MKPVQNLFTPRRVPARYERGASSFPPTRGTTGRPCRARHTGFKAVSTGRGTTNKTTPTPSRHCGLDPQSTGWPCRPRHTGFKAVSTGRGTTDKTTPTPSRHCGLDPQSTEWPCRPRHTGFKAVSTGRDTTNKATKHHLTKIG